MKNEFPQRIDVDEVLLPGQAPSMPAGGKGSPQSAQGSEVARFLARWLDELFKVPGTNFRVGLDPILAFIPGVGDLVASGSGMVIIAEAVRSGVSIPVLMRMGGNMLLNSIIDAIPVAGPFISAFFKSNSRNLTLLKRWQTGHQNEIKKSTFRLFIAFIFIGFLFVAMWVALWVFYLWLFAKMAQKVTGA